MVEQNFGSGRNILLFDIAGQHDYDTAGASVLGLCQFKGGNIGLEYPPSWSAEFNLVLRSNPKVQTFREGRDNNATSSRNVEHIFDFEEKPHRLLV